MQAPHGFSTWGDLGWLRHQHAAAVGAQVPPESPPVCRTGQGGAEATLRPRRKVYVSRVGGNNAGAPGKEGAEKPRQGPEANFGTQKREWNMHFHLSLFLLQWFREKPTEPASSKLKSPSGGSGGAGATPSHHTGMGGGLMSYGRAGSSPGHTLTRAGPLVSPVMSPCS